MGRGQGFAFALDFVQGERLALAKRLTSLSSSTLDIIRDVERHLDF